MDRDSQQPKPTKRPRADIGQPTAPHADPRAETPEGRDAIAASGLVAIAAAGIGEGSMRIPLGSGRNGADKKARTPWITSRPMVLNRPNETALFSYYNLLRTHGPRDGWTHTRLAGSLVVANGGLINLVGKKIGVLPDHPRFDDFWADGMVSLYKAINGFNPFLGWRFSTYGAATIQQNLWKGRAVVAGVGRGGTWMGMENTEGLRVGHSVPARSLSAMHGRKGEKNQSFNFHEASAAQSRTKAQKDREADLRLARECAEALNDPAAMGMTDREASVLRMRASGMTLHQIAHVLKVSHETVRTAERFARRSVMVYVLRANQRGHEVEAMLRKAQLFKIARASIGPCVTPLGVDESDFRVQVFQSA